MMLLKVLERLDRQRFEPYVISLTTLGELAPSIEAFGIPVDAIGMKPSGLNPFKFLGLVRMLKSLNAPIVHTWMYHADLLGGLAARLAGVSAISWCVRNSILKKSETKLSTRAVVGLCASLSEWVPSRILVCSEMARKVHVELGYVEKKMLVVPNGFDLFRFKPDEDARKKIRAELGIAVDTPLVGLIGRFDPVKNHLGFIEAAGLLHRRMPHVHFVLAGKNIDIYNSELVQPISQAGVLNNVHLLGLRNDMPALMAALDVLASSSYGEAFPNVLGEAMACGVPCVATEVGDSAYIVGDTGRVVASGDMPGLAHALEALLVLRPPEKLALNERARARVAVNFEIGKVVKQYEDFYESLLAKAG